MFFDSNSDLIRILAVAPLAYLWVVAVLRVSGKRTLAQLNAFDFIVTVALGSTLSTVILNSSISWTEGALALGLLALFQLVVAWVSVRVGWVRTLGDVGPLGRPAGREGRPCGAGPRAHLRGEPSPGGTQLGDRRSGARRCGGARTGRHAQRHSCGEAGERVGHARRGAGATLGPQPCGCGSVELGGVGRTHADPDCDLGCVRRVDRGRLGHLRQPSSTRRGRRRRRGGRLALIVSLVLELVDPATKVAPLWAVTAFVLVGAGLFVLLDVAVKQTGLVEPEVVCWPPSRWTEFPENLALGVALIGAGPLQVASLSGSIFLSNLPEAAGGAQEMTQGRSRARVMGLRTATAGLLSIAALAGSTSP